MNKSGFLAVFLLLITILLFSCKKEEDVTSPTNPAGINFPDGDGVLVVGKQSIITFVPGIGATQTNTGSGSAFFGSPQASTGAEAGTVRVNGQVLARNASSGVYLSLFESSIVNPPFIWDVSGSGAVQGFTKQINDPMPSYTGQLPENASVNADVTIDLAGKINNADRVIVQAVGNDVIIKDVSPSTNQVTFTKSELSKLGTLRQLIVNAQKLTPQNINNKKYWFILQDSKARVYSVTK